jgi:hypothetical protein
MSFEGDALTVLLARLRETCDISDITENECVFDHLAGGGASKPARVTPSDIRPSAQREVEILRRSLDSSEALRIRMQQTIDEMTRRLQKADDDNKTLKISLKKTGDEYNTVKISLNNANTLAIRFQRSCEESMKNMKDLSERLEERDKLLTDMTVNIDNALKKNKDLEGRLQEETDRVQEFEKLLEKAEDRLTNFQENLPKVGDETEWAAALQRLLKSKDDVLKTEEENLNLLMSLKRAQELLLTSSTFIKEIRDMVASRIGEVQRDGDTKDIFSGKKDLLVERFQELNDNLVQSNILEYAIYDGFVEAFNVAIQELCTPNFLIRMGERRLYREYTKKDNISDSVLTKAFNGFMNAISIFHTIDPSTRPKMRFLKDFDRQVYRESDNIMLIFQGIAQRRTLSVNKIPGYGVIVFWELTSEERARIERKKLYVG